MSESRDGRTGLSSRPDRWARRRFLATLAGGLLAAPLVAETQDCASPTFKKGKFAIPLDRDVVRAEWVSRGYTDINVKPYPRGWSRGEHTHPVHLVVTLVAGMAEFRMAGQHFVLEPGDELCYPAYTVHEARNLYEGTSEMMEGSRQ